MIRLGTDQPVSALPLLLAELRHTLSDGDTIECCLTPHSTQDWTIERAVDLAVGAGFTINAPPTRQRENAHMDLTRIRSLSDTVAPAMRILVVGLNPSPYSADHSIGYARPGNRFWPAALAAGIVSIDRDPLHAVQQHGLGMTDLVRRTTARADQVTGEEFHQGFERVERLAQWLQPSTVCFVGLGGWRQVVDRSATAGLQERTVGGRPVYVMPHTSGLNAHSRLSDLTIHFCKASELADRSSTKMPL